VLLRDLSSARRVLGDGDVAVGSNVRNATRAVEPARRGRLASKRLANVGRTSRRRPRRRVISCWRRARGLRRREPGFEGWRPAATGSTSEAGQVDAVAVARGDRPSPATTASAGVRDVAPSSLSVRSSPSSSWSPPAPVTAATSRSSASRARPRQPADDRQQNRGPGAHGCASRSTCSGPYQAIRPCRVGGWRSSAW
jgi:hypothetical protein